MINLKQLSSSWLGNLLVVFSLSLNSSFAAVCGELPELNIEQCGHYDFIAYGRVDGDLDCESGKVKFTPVDIFKGEFVEFIDVFSECSGKGLPLSKSEYWILFGKRNNAQDIQLHICGHSRKQIPSTQTDYQTDVRGTTFQEDLAFLRANFKSKNANEKDLQPRKYQKVDPVLVPILLGVGLVFMVVGFLVMKRMKK